MGEEAKPAEAPKEGAKPAEAPKEEAKPAEAPKEEAKPEAKVPSKELEEAKAVFDKLAGDDGKVTWTEFFKASNSELLKGFNFGEAAGEDKKMTFDEFKDALVKAGKLEEPAKEPEKTEAPSMMTKEVASKELEEAKAVFDKLAGDDGKVTLMEFFTASSSEMLKGFNFSEAAGEDKKMTFDEFKDALV